MSTNKHRIPITVNEENYATMRRQLAYRGKTVSEWALELINAELRETEGNQTAQCNSRPPALDSLAGQGDESFDLLEIPASAIEDFARYFEAHERERARLLGLMPGEPVPPLNSKAQRRIEPL
jgi:hypothetical protein